MGKRPKFDATAKARGPAERVIEISWLNAENGKEKRVKGTEGGGRRRVKAPLCAMKREYW